jgi:hypothetical protein
MIDDHYPVLAAQLGRCVEEPEHEPDDDDGLTGPCSNCGGKGFTLSDPDGKLLECPDCDGDENTERDYAAERAKEQAEREDAEDYRRELARFDAEGRGR